MQSSIVLPYDEYDEEMIVETSDKSSSFESTQLLAPPPSSSPALEVLLNALELPVVESTPTQLNNTTLELPLSDSYSHLLKQQQQLDALDAQTKNLSVEIDKRTGDLSRKKHQLQEIDAKIDALDAAIRRKRKRFSECTREVNELIIAEQNTTVKEQPKPLNSTASLINTLTSTAESKELPASGKRKGCKKQPTKELTPQQLLKRKRNCASAEAYRDRKRREFMALQDQVIELSQKLRAYETRQQSSPVSNTEPSAHNFKK